MPDKQTHIQDTADGKRASYPNYTPEGIKQTIDNLDLGDKQSIVDLLFAVEAAYVSKGYAADLIKQRFEYSRTGETEGPSESSES